jgi:RNA polymerase sigma factor (sigma-70 family)
LHLLRETGTVLTMAVTETGHLASRAIDDLYRQHGGEVYRYAYAVLGNHADAEDVTQTTFLNAYRALEQGVRPRKPSNWLLTISSNAIKQRFRQEQARPREVELDERLASNEADDEGPSVGELLTALSKIPPQQRQALVLREFEGRSYAEIAEILAVTTSALETLLFRARRSLAEELEHQLTCTEAQLAVSRSVDGRLGRKERRRLRDHLVECPDCASFARSQQRHRKALRGLMLIPIPLSLTMFKGLEGAGTASAATLPLGAGAGAGAVVVSAGVGTGVGATGAATGGGILAGGVALKAAAVVAAVGVAGGVAVTGASESHDKKAKKPAATSTKPGQRLGQVAPRGVVVPGNGIARGKAGAPGQVRRTTTPAGARAAKANTHGQNGLSHRKSSSSSSHSNAGGSNRSPRAHATGTTKPAHTKSTSARTTGTSYRRTGTAQATKPTKPTKPATAPSQPVEQSTDQSAPSSEPATPPTDSATTSTTLTAPTEPTTDTTHGNSGQGSDNARENGRKTP